MITTLFHFHLSEEIANKILFKIFLDDNKIKYREITDEDIEIITDDDNAYIKACQKYINLKMQ